MEEENQERKEAKDTIEKKLNKIKERAELKEKSWEMARICLKIFKENEGTRNTRVNDQKERKKWADIKKQTR